LLYCLLEDNGETHETSQMLRNTTGTVVKSAVQMASQQVLRIQDVLEHSPAARLFVYTGATLSIIPLGIFGVWVGMTLLGTVISASESVVVVFMDSRVMLIFILGLLVIGAMIVEGGLVLLGLSVLIPVEGTILAIAGATAVTYATSGVGMRFIQRYGQTFYTIAGQVSRRLALTTGENEDKGTQRQLSHHEIRRHDRHPEHPSSSRSSYTVSTAYVTTEESLNFSPPKTRTEGSMGSGASTKKKRRVKVSSSRSGTTGRIKSRKSPTGSRYSSPPPL
jgi:hypothetical protein